jgi:SAM-dependent methyltransferase
MSDWQERITRETAPAIRAEHELRYRMAAPLVLPDGPWVDLGCGNGLAARAALGPASSVRAVLVDLEQSAVEQARAELGLPGAVALTADLTDAGDLQRIADAALALGGSPVITCFEVVEHLASFLPLLGWAQSLVAEHGATFVMSVPNDAFFSIENPHHATSWGEGAFEELRSLLGEHVTLMRQVSLAGSALSSWDEASSFREEVRAGGPEAPATHFIAALGPRRQELQRGALVVEAELLAQRQWERQRENDLAMMQKVAGEHEHELERLHETIRTQAHELSERTVWFDEWRVYIHELERELGRPLSGVAADELPVQPRAAEASVQPQTAEPPA